MKWQHKNFSYRDFSMCCYFYIQRNITKANVDILIIIVYD